jgi:geranylgeranyl diphosphate synthase type I
MQERRTEADIVQDTSNEMRRQEIHRRLVLIDEEINRLFEKERGEPKILYDTALHLLQAGGKRIRSLLVILSCEAVGGTLDDALPFAVATEYVQTASLIHDDVVDDDDRRRGVESTHKKYGNRMAIIAGDLLVSHALKHVSHFSSPELMTMLAETGVKMCEGEASDILMYFTSPAVLTEQSYFDTVRRKTASFMRASAKMGGIVGKATDKQLQILDAFSGQMGYAFQIRDDILDVVASVKATGKSTQSDLKGTKVNLVLIHALASSSEDDVEKCIELLNEGNINFALELIEKTNAVKYAGDLAQKYAEKAKDIIRGQGFDNEDLLCILADHAGDRDF